jgi:ATP-dependent 26S proteasome regulatory subunit
MNPYCTIIRILADEEGVKIEFRYINVYDSSGWVRINPETFIRPEGTAMQLKMIKAEDIAVAPEKDIMKSKDDILFFSLYFPPLPPNTKSIDIIEYEKDDETAFNFYSVSLTSNITMTTEENTSMLQKIEQVALELKGTTKEHKSFQKELARIQPKLKEIGHIFEMNEKEAALFSLAFYLSVTTESFTVSEIKRHTNFRPFDFYEIKQIVYQLFKKGWFVKLRSVNVMFHHKRGVEKLYTVQPKVMEQLYLDQPPVLNKITPDVYYVTDQLEKCLHEYFDDEIDADEMRLTVEEYEQEFAAYNPIKLAHELVLNKNEKMFFYYAVTKTLAGATHIDIDKMISNLIEGHYERSASKKAFVAGDGILFKEKIFEFVNADFKVDKDFKMTSEGVKRVFGEDACLLSKEVEVVTGICKLIKHETIQAKELFYNPKEQASVKILREMLDEERYTQIVERLAANQMRNGLTVLLHGQPGTGKTETIYQLARETKRNILLVDISQIRDKYVGESEKRLKAIFETYRDCMKHFPLTPILLFNEADALIGRRINIHSSVDQMNNTMQNILLQELEDFNGILMATTNLTGNLDSAFDRRFLYKIKYARPSSEAKQAIWKSKMTMLNDDEATILAETYKFSGGQIENISRKVFLEALIFGKQLQLDEIMTLCNEESYEINRASIGFKNN